MANFFVDPHAVMPTDAITRRRILAQLPEIQRRKRRASQLRTTQASFEAMRDKERALGGFLPEKAANKGGLGYDIVQSYIPDRAGQMEKAIGAIGSYLTNKKADTAEDEYNTARNAEIMDALGQYGKDTDNPLMSNDQELRGYLGMMGEDVKDIIGKQAHVQSRYTDDDGNVVLVMSDGTEKPTGRKSDFPIGTVTDANGNVLQYGKSGGGRGKVAPLGGQIPGTAPPDEGPQIDVPGNAETGAPAMGIEGMPPEVQQELQATIASMTALGMPQETIDEYVGRAAAKAQQMQAPPEMQPPPGQAPAPISVQSQPGMAPPPPNPGAAAAAGEPEYGPPGGVPPATYPGAAQMLATNPATGGVRVLTPGEEAAQKEAAQIAARNAAMVPTAEAESLGAEAKKVGENRAAAKELLPKARLALDQFRRQAMAAINHPQIRDVLGGSVPGAIPEEWDVARSMMRGALSLGGGVLPGKAGENAKGRANAMSILSNIKGKVYAQAYETLRGGGAITEKETERVAAAYGRLETTQDYDAYVEGINEIISAYEDGIKKLEDAVNRPAVGPQAAPAGPALPPGFSWEP